MTLSAGQWNVDGKTASERSRANTRVATNLATLQLLTFDKCLLDGAFAPWVGCLPVTGVLWLFRVLDSERLSDP